VLLLKAQRLAKIDTRDFPMETLILKTDLEKSPVGKFQEEKFEALSIRSELKQKFDNRATRIKIRHECNFSRIIALVVREKSRIRANYRNNCKLLEIINQKGYSLCGL